jgi:hypothetical protein
MTSTADQFFSERAQPLQSALCRAHFQDEVLTLTIAEPVQRLNERPTPHLCI